jgi:hypothetical protein
MFQKGPVNVVDMVFDPCLATPYVLRFDHGSDAFWPYDFIEGMCNL